MEFFVFVEGNDQMTQGFSISLIDAEMEISKVVEKFSELMKEKNPDVDFSDYNVYFYNYSNPIEAKEPELVPDLSVSLNSLKTQNFDLILSKTPPQGDMFSDFYAEQEVEEESKFDQFIQQGKMYYELKDYQSAFQLFQHASTLNKNAYLPIYYQIKIFLKAKRYSAALSLTQTAIAKYPKDRSLLNLLAKAHQLCGRHNEAILYYKRMLLLPPHTQQSFDEVNSHIAKSLIEMGSLDQAMSLLQPIATNNPTNLKVLLLMAKTLYLQGRIHDALHIVLQSFSIDPYHKESREFIGNCITTENQAEILRSQLGDGIHDSKVLYIMGYILFEHGSCDIARQFLKDSLDMNPDEPSIALTDLMNTLCISNTCIQTLDAAMPYINRISQRKDDFSKIANSIDFIHFISCFSDKEKYEPPQKDIKPVIFGDKEHVYHMEQLDVFWYLFTIQTLLYTNGYISKAREIGEKLLPLMQPYNFQKTVINQEIPIFGLICSLASSIALPLKEVKKELYFIGDSHCLPLSWKTVKISGEEALIMPLFIDQLAIKHLIVKRDPVTTMFLHILASIPEKSDVVLCVGYIDCLDRIFSKLSRIENDSFQEGFNPYIDAYAQMCVEIIKMKKFRLFIHPIPPTGFDSPLYAHAFNECLASRIKKLEAQEENLFYLDFFGSLISNDGKDEIIKQEFVFDHFHLNPSYLQLFENSINTSIGRKKGEIQKEEKETSQTQEKEENQKEEKETSPRTNEKKEENQKEEKKEEKEQTTK